ncbi:MAG: hypothetical protein R3301_11270, partial [Saprospiraceae bacterium]|nr:hypothetical protein [Saprospiraceae bacterium]
MSIEQSTSSGRTLIDVRESRNLLIFFILVVPAALLAFWKTYVSILGSLPERMNVIYHIHAITMTMWLCMLVAQTYFIRTRRIRLHKRTGRLSYLLAPVIVFWALATTQSLLNQTPADA